MNEQAAKLREVAATLEARSADLPKTAESAVQRFAGAEYEAKVYIFTPDALKAYTQRVIEAEREKTFPVGPRPWTLTGENVI